MNSLVGPSATRRFVLVFIIIVLATSLAATTFGYVLVLQKSNDMQSQVSDLQNQVSTLRNIIVGSINPQYQVIQKNISLSQLYENVSDSVVMISGLIVQTTYNFFGQQIQQVTQVQGSGFIYNYTGRMVVVTNYHVIDGAVNITVAFRDGDAYRVEAVLGYDVYSDLAVLSVDAPASEFKPLQVARSSTLIVGDYVIAVGNPFGLTGSMTTGIVSQLGRTVTETTSSFPIADVIQTSAPINPGNSGGPLLNDKGQVVGITFAIATTGMGTPSQGVGFAIPSDTILREITPLVTTGSYNQHPWLGVAGTDMTYDIAKAMNQNITYGVLITQITSGGPAAKAGLKAGTQQALIDGTSMYVGGDVITAIDGTRIVNFDSLSTYLEENTIPNQTITITIVRNSQTMNVSLILGARPLTS